MDDATEITKMWNRPAIVCSDGGIPINDFHLREKDAEIATLRARIKALESAQGARVPEGYDTIAGNGCSQQSVKEMQPKPLEIEPNGRHEKARRDSDLKIRNCGQIGRRNEVLSSGMQRGERAVCAEGGEDYQVTNGAGEALNPPLAAAPPAPTAPSREPMTEAELREIFGKHFRETYECEPKDALTTAMLNTILAALTEVSRSGGGCNFPACSCKPGAMCSCVVGSSRALQNDGPLREALRWIQQRANESGTGEMGLIDTIHAMHKRATDALATPSGNVTDEMVERAAQAAYESQTFASDLPWAEVKTDRWHRAARAALHSALRQGEE